MIWNNFKDIFLNEKKNTTDYLYSATIHVRKKGIWENVHISAHLYDR